MEHALTQNKHVAKEKDQQARALVSNVLIILELKKMVQNAKVIIAAETRNYS